MQTSKLYHNCMTLMIIHTICMSLLGACLFVVCQIVDPEEALLSISLDS